MIMRSIRVSMMLYFLGLLSVALGVALVFVDRSARRALHDKEEATRDLIQAKYNGDVKKEKQRFDDALLAKAQALAQRVRIRTDWNRALQLHAVGLLDPRPIAPFLNRLWLAQGPRGPMWGLYRRAATEIDLHKSELDVGPKGQFVYQIDSTYRGQPLRSPSLENPFTSPEGFAKDKGLHWEFDNYPAASDRVMRRIRLKATSTQRVNIWPQRPRPGPRGGRRGRGERVEQPVAIFIQCARDTQARDEAIAHLRAARDEELARLEEDTATTLARQRQRLLVISLVTFAATVFGTFCLVWLGLAPLRRLSEAVSRVSPRDFKLPIDEARLPQELRPITRRVAATLKQLERAFAREKQATADISHELRTPLAALLTTSELALRKPRSAEDYRELLQDCYLSAQQMNKIVERLLTLARLDAGVDRLRPQAVDVAAVAEQCAAVVRPLAEARGLRLGVNATGAARLTTDPDKLREVLTNLLHNAIQYNRPDGSVDLRVARENGHLEVEVSDTGVGIAPEAREHIFERFYRADPSRRTDDLHAGLGLAIVKEYVDLMGGQIAVESEPGRGSTFRVRLPAA
jgi:heavy metal sensor kinase